MSEFSTVEDTKKVEEEGGTGEKEREETFIITNPNYGETCVRKTSTDTSNLTIGGKRRKKRSKKRRKKKKSKKRRKSKKKSKRKK